MYMARSCSYGHGLPAAGQNDLAFIGASSAMKREFSSQSVGSNHPDFEPFSISPGVSGIPNQSLNFDQNIATGSDIGSFAQNDSRPRLSITPTIAVFDVEDYLRKNAEQDTLSFDCNSVFKDPPPFNAIASPVSPCTLWSGSSGGVPLSRTGSMTSYSSSWSFPASVEMAKMYSNSSHSTGIGECGDGSGNGSPTKHATSSPQQPDHRVSMPSGQLDGQSFLEDIPSSHRHRASMSSQRSTSSQTGLLSPFDHEMRRSFSSQSHVSDLADATQQSKRSARRRSSKSRQPPSRSIAPKATEIIEPTSAPNMVRIRSSDGTSRKVGILPRRKPPPDLARETAKLKCLHCDRVPDGFRGDHELLRHMSLFHSKKRKAWICVNRMADRPDFLSHCKACTEGKAYGAYYNAAAHLRRVHFDPRPRGRKAKNSSEKRGGKAGGSWPPMEELKKYWLKEIEISNVDPSYEDDDFEGDEEEEVEPVLQRGKLAPPSAGRISTAQVSQQFASSFMSTDTIDSAYPDATPMNWHMVSGEGLWPAQPAELLRQIGQPFDVAETPVGSFAVEDEHLSTPSNFDHFLQ